MDETDALRQAFRDKAKPLSRRQIRAARTRARALSPVRILIQLALVPVVTVALTITIYIRTSPYDPPDALRHLLAMGGCEVAANLNLVPSFRGELGYHDRNDPDQDGVACGTNLAEIAPDQPDILPPVSEDNAQTPGISGAKFLRPRRKNLEPRRKAQTCVTFAHWIGPIRS